MGSHEFRMTPGAGLSRGRLWVSAVALTLVILYVVGEAITALAWSRAPYNWADNYISDLGVPECVELDRTVCSPLFWLMDATFVLTGLLALVALVALRPAVAGWRRVIAVPTVLYAIGIIMVGVFPGSFAENIGGDATRALLHSVGALLAIGVGNLMVLTGGIIAWRPYRGYAVVSIILAATGLAAIVLMQTGNDLGLGRGGIERMTVYPIVAWLVATGLSLICVAVNAHGSHRDGH